MRSERELILDDVIRDVLMNRLLKDWRDWYGTPGETNIGLNTGQKPSHRTHINHSSKDTTSSILIPIARLTVRSCHGNWALLFTVVYFRRPTRSRKMIHKEGHPIALVLFNIGGASNGDVFGGCIVYYDLVRKDGKWIVEYAGAFRP